MQQTYNTASSSVWCTQEKRSEVKNKQDALDNSPKETECQVLPHTQMGLG
jgi:hypothetical protein